MWLLPGVLKTQIRATSYEIINIQLIYYIQQVKRVELVAGVLKTQIKETSYEII